MNDSLLVWSAVLALIVVAVLLYCLWRLLARRPARPVTGGATVDEPGESVGISAGGEVDAAGELEGVDLLAARGRARAAAVQRAEQREIAAARADPSPATAGPAAPATAAVTPEHHDVVVDAHAAPSGLPDFGAGVSTTLDPGPGPRVTRGVDGIPSTGTDDDLP